jgi:hypothetical protein
MSTTGLADGGLAVHELPSALLYDLFQDRRLIAGVTAGVLR